MKKFILFFIFCLTLFYSMWVITSDSYDFITHFKESEIILQASYGMFIIFSAVISWGATKI